MAERITHLLLPDRHRRILGILAAQQQATMTEIVAQLLDRAATEARIEALLASSDRVVTRERARPNARTSTRISTTPGSPTGR